ncbi:MAG TPA: MFS transporter [Streptosporangiaceae bacterium]
MRAYREFLRTPSAPRLLGGTLLGRLPNGMGGLAIVLFVRAHGGGYTLAGALSALWVVALAAGQPVLGRAMDRYGQPRILLASALAAAAGFTALAVLGIDTLALTVAAVLVAGFCTPPLEAGLRALWPTVLPTPAQVRTAYSLDAAAQELIFTFGPLLVVVVAAVSKAVALIVTGLLGVAGTVIVASSHSSRRWRGAHRAADWAGPLRAPGLRVLVAVFACVGFALGALSVAAVTYADARHNSSASGLLLAVNSAGALFGGLLYGSGRHGRGDAGAFTLLLAGLAAGYLPLALAPALPFMIPLAFLSGLFLAPALAATFTLIDALAPQGTVTEAFAWLVTGMAGGAAAGAAAAGIMSDHTGVHGAFAGAGAGGLLALAIALVARSPLTKGSTAAPEPAARVSAPPRLPDRA